MADDLPVTADHFLPSGVDESGEYLSPPRTLEELVALAQQEFHLTPAKDRRAAQKVGEATSKPQLGFNAWLEDPAQARWGVILPPNASAGLKSALDVLIRHRASTLRFEPPVFEYEDGLTAAQFLVKHGVARGSGEVEKIPYYLLVVGKPTEIPFRFQFELDSEYATGRLGFDDPANYEAYIRQLIEYEKAPALPTSREAVFWATSNPGDTTTRMTAELLVQPLAGSMNNAYGLNTRVMGGAEATKSNLASVLAREQMPALLFTASHGLGFTKPTPGQHDRQGAFITQEWQAKTPVTVDARFAAADVPVGSRARGLVHFAFACFSAGTPRQDDYTHGDGAVAPMIADEPFIAALPQHLLAGGALAFLGHVESTWTYSFLEPGSAPNIVAFTRALQTLAKGAPVGHALRDLHDRGAQLAASLIESLHDVDFGAEADAAGIARNWIQRNDARAFMLLGDPAAHIRAA